MASNFVIFNYAMNYNTTCIDQDKFSNSGNFFMLIYLNNQINNIINNENIINIF